MKWYSGNEQMLYGQMSLCLLVVKRHRSQERLHDTSKFREDLLVQKRMVPYSRYFSLCIGQVQI